MSSKIKFCKSSSGKIWYIYGFHFKPISNKWEHCVVCYDRVTVWKKKNKLYIIEVDESVKDMYLSSDTKDHIMAETILQATFKSSPKKLVKGREL